MNTSNLSRYPSVSQSGLFIKAQFELWKRFVQNRRKPIQDNIVMSKKKESKVARIKKITSEYYQRGRATKVADRPIKFVEDDVKMEGWQLDLLAKEYHWKTLRKFISSDPVLLIMKPKVISPIQGPVTAPAAASNLLEGINGIVQLLREAGFVAGELDVKQLLKCDQSQVIYANRSLYDS